MVPVFWCLTRLFVLTAMMVISLVLMSKSDFCASVFETQIGKLTLLIKNIKPVYHSHAEFISSQYNCRIL